MTADDVITAARMCLDTPFAHQGRIKGIALDCAGLAVSVARDLGIEYKDVQGYGRDPYQNTLKDALDIQPSLDTIPRDEMQAGDIMLIRFGREPQHLAIFTGLKGINGVDGMIHGYEPAGIVCEHDIDNAWRRRIFAVYRFKGLS